MRSFIISLLFGAAIGLTGAAAYWAYDAHKCSCNPCKCTVDSKCDSACDCPSKK